MAEGGVDEAPPTGPLEDRLVHKNWKWRVAAYEELEKLFQTAEDGNSPVFNEYGICSILVVRCYVNAYILPQLVCSRRYWQTAMPLRKRRGWIPSLHSLIVVTMSISKYSCHQLYLIIWPYKPTYTNSDTQDQ
jgi:hypothetical protein